MEAGRVVFSALKGVVETCNLVVYVAFLRVILNLSVLGLFKVCRGNCVFTVTLVATIVSVIPILKANAILVP